MRLLQGPARLTGSRARAWAGIAGPAAFVAAWGVLGATRGGYSSVNDPISRLAEIGSPTRPVMTAALLTFAAGVVAYVPVLRLRFPGSTARAATVTALATVGIAAAPLGGRGGDEVHGVIAGIAYVGWAAMPLLAGRTQLDRGERTAATVSIGAGLAIAVALATSVLQQDRTGLTQRLGLTIGDLWFMASAAAELRSASSHRERRGVVGG